METPISQRAKTWKFDFQKLNEAHKEQCLRLFHGDEWYEDRLKNNTEDLYTQQFYAFCEVNALIANVLIRASLLPYEKGGVDIDFEAVSTYRGLKISEDVQACIWSDDGEAEVDNFNFLRNEKVEDIMKEYIFWGL